MAQFKKSPILDIDKVKKELSEAEVYEDIEIIDALMRNDKFLAEMYIEEIIRSTMLSESYRKNTGR